jgi:uncharacterized protein (DUF362 family)
MFWQKKEVVPKGKQMDRREFFKRVAALSLVMGAKQIFSFPPELWAMAAKERPVPVLAQAKGTNYAHLVGDAVDALGGMKKFVHPGEVVVVKPNIHFSRPPEMGANTNPQVVKKVVELCLEAGAKKVKVFDRSNSDPRVTYTISGIKAAVESIKDSRAVVEFVDERRFIGLNIDEGKSLKRWSFYKDVLEADRFINVPVAKTHHSCRLTMAMKNMMGVLGGERGTLHVNLHQNIADMNLIVRPDLHVLDATRIITQNGPTGGRLEDVQIKNTVIAGTDPVAVDAYGTTLFDLKPEDIGYIVKAHELGLGEMQLTKIKVLTA